MNPIRKKKKTTRRKNAADNTGEVHHNGMNNYRKFWFIYAYKLRVVFRSVDELFGGGGGVVCEEGFETVRK